MPERLKHHTVRALRWSERYTNLDMVYFASGSFWQSFGQATSSILALGLMLVFANFLPKEVYGTYRYLISLAGILNVFTLTGMSQAVAQAVANGREGVLRASVRYQLKWNSILMLIFLVVALYYVVHQNFAYTWGLVALAISVPLTNAFNTYGAYLTGKRNFRLNNIFSVLTTLIYTLGMLLAIFASGTVVWLIIAFAVTTAAANILFYFITLRMFAPPKEEEKDPRDVFAFGRSLTYISLLKPVAGQLDSIILNHFYGPAPLAVYSMAMAIPNRAIPFIKDWVDLGFPKLAVKTPEEINKTFYQRIVLGMIIGAVFAAAYALVAPYLFKYLMPQYLDAVLYTQLLAVTFIFAMPNRYISTLLNAQKMAKRIFANTIAISAIQLSLYLVLGIWGGVLGLIVAQVLNSLIGLMVNIASWRFARA